MAKIKVEVDGKEVEVDEGQLKLPEGYAIITPDNVPDGYYTDDAFEAKIGGRVRRAKEDTKTALLSDDEFHKTVLNKYGIQLDEDGKPKGIKTTEDVEKIKKEVAQQIEADWKSKLEQKDEKLNSLLGKGKKSAIIEGASKIGIDGKYLEPLVEGGSPYLVREVEDQFEWNDEIGDYALKDKDGTFAVDGNGFVTTQKFFEKNQDKFKHMLKDQRQRGSNFNGQGTVNGSKPKGDPSKWKLDKKLSYIKEHGKEGYQKAIDNYTEPEASEE